MTQKINVAGEETINEVLKIMRSLEVRIEKLEKLNGISEDSETSEEDE